MTGLVPVRRVPRAIEGEVIAPSNWPEFTRQVHEYQEIHFRDWHPSPFMRALGYTRNPDTCRHGRKGFTPRDGWWCMECGDSL
jgi:hypothetical protein